jgi:hypothetical protein
MMLHHLRGSYSRNTLHKKRDISTGSSIAFTTLLVLRIQTGVKDEKAALAGCPFENLSPLRWLHREQITKMSSPFLVTLPKQVKC